MEINNKTFKDFIYLLSPTKDTNYTLQKVLRIKKHPLIYTPPVRDKNGTMAPRNTKKAERERDVYRVSRENIPTE